MARGAHPHAAGGLLLRAVRAADSIHHRPESDLPGATSAEDTLLAG